MYQIDLNSDMGESFGAYKIGNDEGILPCITSANIACGYHAGDPMVMDKVVKNAKAQGVAVGAHPGYPDLMGFGRRKMVLSPDEIKNYMKYQIGALWAFVHSSGMKLQHVAPHGALGNLCQYDREVSRAICEAVYEIDPSIMIFYCAGAPPSPARTCPSGAIPCASMATAPRRWPLWSVSARHFWTRASRSGTFSEFFHARKRDIRKDVPSVCQKTSPPRQINSRDDPFCHPFSDWCCQKPLRQAVRQNIQGGQPFTGG